MAMYVWLCMAMYVWVCRVGMAMYGYVRMGM